MLTFPLYSGSCDGCRLHRTKNILCSQSRNYLSPYFGRYIGNKFLNLPFIFSFIQCSLSRHWSDLLHSFRTVLFTFWQHKCQIHFLVKHIYTSIKAIKLTATWRHILLHSRNSGIPYVQCMEWLIF